MKNSKTPFIKPMNLFVITMMMAGILLSTTTFSQTWNQLGIDMDGEAALDQSGYSVSMPDAYTVAIGAPLNDGTGSKAGHVRIYNWNGSAWMQKGADIDGEAGRDRSGWSVSMPDANTVAIGAPSNGGSGINAGHVRIYSWNGSAWVQKGTDIDGGAALYQSGYSVSMPDSNTVAIGAYSYVTDLGYVRIYTWNGSAWVQLGADIDGEAADQSGRSVSMPDNNTVAIGAPLNDGNGSNAGHVRIYSWNGSAWVQKGIDIDGEAASDQSGYSVSMPDSNTVAIGAPSNDGNGTAAGHVRIYSWNGSAWVQVGADIDGEAANDHSGRPVSMPDANTVAIGAYNNDGNGNESGHVRVYSFCPASTSSFSVAACNSYTVPSGDETYTTSQTVMDTIPNVAGCDSVMTITVTINTVDVSVTDNSPTLTANATGATYQWLDCNNSFSIIAGETKQNFTATSNGSYAVEVTEGSCTDTSACFNVTNTGIVENGFGSALAVYPNPTSGNFSVDLGKAYENIAAIITDLNGKLISKHNYKQTQLLDLELNEPAGIYFVRIEAGTKKAVIQLVKQ